MIHVTNIQWDVDPCPDQPEATYEELLTLYNLPTEVKLNTDIDEDDHISDLLTDEYDWCVSGFEYTKYSIFAFIRDLRNAPLIKDSILNAVLHVEVENDDEYTGILIYWDRTLSEDMDGLKSLLSEVYKYVEDSYWLPIAKGTSDLSEGVYRIQLSEDRDYVNGVIL